MDTNIEETVKILDQAELEQLKDDVAKLKKAVRALDEELKTIKDALGRKADNTHSH